MLREALQYIVDKASKPHQVEKVGTRTFHNGTFEEFPGPRDKALSLEFHTLSGLVSYIASPFDGGALEGDEPRAIVVEGPCSVRLIDEADAEFRERESLAVAVPFSNKGFPFDTFTAIDNFVIRAQACFQDTPERANLLAVVGNLRADSGVTVEDDGVSQVAAAKVGIAKLANVKVPNPVPLRPYRTFAELLQPGSNFVLRITAGDDGAPRAGLFEVEDSLWKLEAIRSIHERLDELLGEAGVSIPIFA